MGLHKGQTNNPKGRPKGSKNRVSKDLKELIDAFLNEKFELVKDQLNELPPKDQRKFFTNLLPYVVPKLQDTKQEVEINNPWLKAAKASIEQTKRGK